MLGHSRSSGSTCQNSRGGTANFALIAWLVLLLVSPVALAQDDPRAGPKLVREGNKLLEQGKYAEALAAYEKAAEELPDSPEVAYNRGVAFYQLGRLDQAEPAFQDALQPGDPELEAMAKYNLGRCTHAAALDQGENLEAAINDLSRAIRFYQDALQLTPDDPDALKNKELAERLRTYWQKRVEQQEEEQPTSQPSSQPTSQPTSQPQQQPSSQPSSQPTSQPQQGDQQQDQEGDQQQDQEGDQQDQSPQDSPGQPDQQQGTEGEQDQESQGEEDQPEQSQHHRMTPEEAEKFLQEARDMERERRKEQRKRAMRRRGLSPVDKDW